MAWLESHQELGRHPKLMRLASELRIHKAQALGHLQYLWWWALDFAPMGDLSAFASAEISNAAEWPGDAEKFHKSLKKIGWIDPDGKIHDWMDYAGPCLMSRRRQKRYRKRLIALRNGDVTVTATVQDSTEPDHTEHKKPIPRKGAPPEGYAKLVGHVCTTYEAKKGHKYPFRALDGGVVKRLLGLYTVSQVMALWDMFLDKSWDWMKDGKLIKCAHDLRQFQSKITVLLEDSSWRKRAEKHEGQENGKIASLVCNVGEPIPHVPVDPLAGKIDALKAINGVT